MFEANLSGKDRRSRALELLDRVGLKYKAKIRSTKLPDWKIQRLSIARALANKPSIILADEPTRSLDSRTSKKILEHLNKLHKEKNVALIMITYDMNVAKLADRIIEILDGKILNSADDSLLIESIEI